MAERVFDLLLVAFAQVQRKRLGAKRCAGDYLYYVYVLATFKNYKSEFYVYVLATFKNYMSEFLNLNDIEYNYKIRI